MQVYCFHLMPWAYLPEDFCRIHKSAWVVCPNTLYDPELGLPLYNRYLDELELADQLGSTGLLNEHHQTAYGGHAVAEHYGGLSGAANKTGEAGDSRQRFAAL